MTGSGFFGAVVQPEIMIRPEMIIAKIRRILICMSFLREKWIIADNLAYSYLIASAGFATAALTAW